MRKLFRYLHNPILPHLPLETRGGGLFFCYGGGGCKAGWQPWPLDQYRSNKKVSAKAISSSNTYCSSHGGSDAIPFISLIRRQRQKKKKEGETFCSLEVCQSSPSALSAESSPKNLKASSKWSLDVQPRLLEQHFLRSTLLGILWVLRNQVFKTICYAVSFRECLKLNKKGHFWSLCGAITLPALGMILPC